MTDFTESSQNPEVERAESREKPLIFILCPVCGDPLCPHGICERAEPEYACQECARSILMDAMKHVSIVSGPAMDGKQYRAFMDAMGIFSQATKEIWGFTNE